MSTPLIASIEPGFRTFDGLRIRFADSGGPQEPVLLLTSPWPESLYAFTPMWPALAEFALLLLTAVVRVSIPKRPGLHCVMDVLRS